MAGERLSRKIIDETKKDFPQHAGPSQPPPDQVATVDGKRIEFTQALKDEFFKAETTEDWTNFYLHYFPKILPDTLKLEVTTDLGKAKRTAILIKVGVGITFMSGFVHAKLDNSVRGVAYDEVSKLSDRDNWKFGRYFTASHKIRIYTRDMKTGKSELEREFSPAIHHKELAEYFYDMFEVKKFREE